MISLTNQTELAALTSAGIYLTKYIGPYNFYYLILSCNQFTIYYRFILNPKAVATNHSPLSLARFSPCGLACDLAVRVSWYLKYFNMYDIIALAVVN